MWAYPLPILDQLGRFPAQVAYRRLSKRNPLKRANPSSGLQSSLEDPVRDFHLVTLKSLRTGRAC